mmetsp:Transcript_13940/g.35620  ORF Transcript_13940/g.35620 Transcript_13940/m.35620 type:complete len:148 (+) Transcript_13940:422-865(+)
MARAALAGARQWMIGRDFSRTLSSRKLFAVDTCRYSRQREKKSNDDPRSFNFLTKQDACYGCEHECQAIANGDNKGNVDRAQEKVEEQGSRHIHQKRNKVLPVGEHEDKLLDEFLNGPISRGRRFFKTHTPNFEKWVGASPHCSDSK